MTHVTPQYVFSLSLSLSLTHTQVRNVTAELTGAPNGQNSSVVAATHSATRTEHVSVTTLDGGGWGGGATVEEEDAMLAALKRSAELSRRSAALVQPST